MSQVIVGDLRTGRRWQNVPFQTYRWEQRRNQPETLSCTIDMSDIGVRAKNFRNTATEGKSFLAIIENGDVFPAAGPMLQPEYDQDEAELTLSAFGMGGWFAGLPILPPLGASIPTTQFVVPDPADNTATIPNPALATSFTNLTYGSMIRKVIAQWMGWPGGDLPIVLPDSVAGTAMRDTVNGVDFKDIAAWVSDITKLEDGVDVAFDPRWIASRLGVEWLLRTGTPQQPRFRSPTVHRWDLSVEQRNTRKFNDSADGSTRASIAFFTGGRSSDVALVERAADPYLTDLGFPLRVTVDTSHSTESQRPTLNAYARQEVALGRRSTRFYTFQVRKTSTPMFGQYRIGDLCDLVFRKDPYIPDGTYRREIAALSGDQGDWITVTTSEVTDG